MLMLTNVALAATPVKVLGTTRNEIDPSAESGHLAYALGRVGHPNRFDVYLRRPASVRIKVNAPSTQGFEPTIDLANAHLGDALVFAQKGAGDADIKIWNVGSGGRSNPPVGVNTAASEWNPSLDGDHLLFGRGPANQFFMTRIILYNLTMSTPTAVDVAPPNGIVFPGIVNGDWASWTECSSSDCRAWRYRISTARKTEVPSSARLIYTSAIGQDGTVWYVQSGIGCGANVKIRRHEIATAPTTLVDFPPGADANISDLDDSGARRQVFFSRVNCSNVNNWNLYRVAGEG
ncbi:MAG: hypothetical protein M3138_08470 [Actinomycetota bacterium]|nr:hypothetical protein [Actinomycetota bacterium]